MAIYFGFSVPIGIGLFVSKYMILGKLLDFIYTIWYNVFEIEKGCLTLEKLQPNLYVFELLLVRF